MCRVGGGGVGAGRNSFEILSDERGFSYVFHWTEKGLAFFYWS